MQKYVEVVERLAGTLKSFKITQVPRSNNRQADALNKLASTSFDHLSKKVLVEVLKERSIDECRVSDILVGEATWMTPLVDYLQYEILPPDEKEARKIKIKDPQFVIRGDSLFKRGYLTPWLKCISQAQGRAVLEDVHEGEVGAHEGARALIGKILRMGMYWPDAYKDAQDITQKCVARQTFVPIHQLPATPLSSMTFPWPFYQWGIDIVGPFLEAPRKVKFLLVAIDYLAKWIEAEPLASITGRAMIKFFWM